MQGLLHCHDTTRLTLGRNSTQEGLVATELIRLFVEDLHGFRVVAEFERNIRQQVGLSVVCAKVSIVDAINKGIIKLTLAETKQIKTLGLNKSTIHAVLTIKELDNITTAITHSVIITHTEILKSLNETTLNITSLSCLTSSINETFTTTHGVEVELLRGETLEVRVFDETTRLGTKIILVKVRQGTVAETKRNTLTLNVLLTYTTHNLRNVNETSLGTRGHSGLEVVFRSKRLDRLLTGVITSLVETNVHMILETLLHSTSRLDLEHSALTLFDEISDLELGSFKNVTNLGQGGVISHCITNTNGETVVENEVVANLLNLVHENTGNLRTHFVKARVHQATLFSTECRLVNNTSDDFTILNEYLCIFRVKITRKLLLVVMAVSACSQVDTMRDDLAEHLLTSPQSMVASSACLIWDHNGWNRDVTCEVLDPHELVKDLIAVKKNVTASHAPRSQKGVLHNTHDRTVTLGGDNHLVHHHVGFCLGTGCQALRHVQVHLITIKISVVRGRHTKVHAESGPVHDTDTMSHDTHLVQRWLTVEEHNIIVGKVTFHNPSSLEHNVIRVAVTQIHFQTLIVDNVACTGVLVRTILDKSFEALEVERGDSLWHGQIESNRPGHTDLVNTQVGICRNHSTGRKIHTFTHEVTTHTTLLTNKTLTKRFQRLSALLACLSLVRQLVIHKGGAVVLQHLDILIQHVICVTISLTVEHGQVGLDNVTQLVSKIILTASSTTHTHTGAHLGWRHREDLKNEPGRMAPLGVKAQLANIIIGYLFEDLKSLLSGESLLSLSSSRNLIFVCLFTKVHHDLKTILAVARLRQLRARAGSKTRRKFAERSEPVLAVEELELFPRD
mmetsp:Transcript_11451/g.22494  ORF Transcript_11451/g.22494 Transcript_11451/m.22494 type:complete len:848 (-) Transcript_11451:1065-3608(-)